MTEPVYEVVVFGLKPGVDRARWQLAAAEVHDFLGAQPGFIDRSLLAPSDGGDRWVDVVRWRSLTEAERAATAFAETFETCEFMEGIDPETMQFMHLEPVATLAAPAGTDDSRGA